MGVNKNFVVKNGLEVDSGLLLANSVTQKVGIGSTSPRAELDVRGGIAATDIQISGISTILGEFNIGPGGLTLTAIGGSYIGIGSANPAYLVDIAGAGSTALYVDGDAEVTGKVTTPNLVVSGISSFGTIHANAGIVTLSRLNVTGITTLNNLMLTGVGTASTIHINDGTATLSSLDVTGLSTFQGNVSLPDNVQLQLGTDDELRVFHNGTHSFIENHTTGNLVIQNGADDSDIVLNCDDGSGGTTQYFRADGSTGEVTLSYYGSDKLTTKSNGIDVTGHTETDTLRVSGITTFTGEVDANGRIVGAAVSNVIPFLYSDYSDLPSAITYHGAFAHVHSTGKALYAHAANWIELVNKEVNGTVGLGTERYNVGPVNATSLSVSGITTVGIVTGSNAVYYGDGQYLENVIRGFGLNKNGSLVGFGVTYLDLRGTGLSTTFYDPTVGIATVFIEGGGGGGGGGSISISTEAPGSPSHGDLWYSPVYARTFIYYDEAIIGIGGTDAQWVDAAPFNTKLDDDLKTEPGKAAYTFVAGINQSQFVVSYTVGYIEVYLNGIRLNDSEYTANNGSSIFLASPATVGDILDVIEYRIGIGNTGPAGAPGPAGPLPNVTNNTSSQTQYPLIVAGVGTTLASITTTSNYFGFIPSTGKLTVNQLTVASDSQFGNVTSLNVTGIATASSINITGVTTANVLHSNALVVTGITTSTDFNTTSDLYLKENIEPITNPLTKLNDLNGVTFNWKDTREKSAGLIAQQIEKVMPEIVNESNGHKVVNYNGIIALLVETCKKQQHIIADLDTKINNLNERLGGLESKEQ